MIYSTWKGCVLNILLVGLKMAISFFLPHQNSRIITIKSTTKKDKNNKKLLKPILACGRSAVFQGSTVCIGINVQNNESNRRRVI